MEKVKAKLLYIIQSGHATSALQIYRPRFVFNFLVLNHYRCRRRYCRCVYCLSPCPPFFLIAVATVVLPSVDSRPSESLGRTPKQRQQDHLSLVARHGSARHASGSIPLFLLNPSLISCCFVPHFVPSLCRALLISAATPGLWCCFAFAFLAI